jgi:predicted glycosyltransferase involved in capsule biosynthesis
MSKTFVIVPYRNRREQLGQFEAHMCGFLPPQSTTIVIAEQSASRPFNRGAILNAAVKWLRSREELTNGKDRIIFHDVDLLPSQDLLYAYDSTEPVMHIASVWKRYNSSSYFGGVLLIRLESFLHVNGYPNHFWGWGGEDDELRDRISFARIPITKATSGCLTDLEGLSLKEKLHKLKQDGTKCMDKWEVREGYRRRRRRGLGVEGYRESSYDVKLIQKKPNNVFHILISIS